MIEINSNLCSQEEARKIYPLLPLFQELADFWSINISLDSPHRDLVVDAGEKKDTLEIHLFSIPAISTSPGIFRIIKEVFGYPLPVEGLTEMAEWSMGLPWIEGENVGKLYYSKEPQRALFSPEGEKIAEIRPMEIFILFDILHQPWEGQEKVLKEILELTIPRALRGWYRFTDRVSIYKFLQARHYRQAVRFRTESAKENFYRFFKELCLENFRQFLFSAQERKRNYYSKLEQTRTELIETADRTLFWMGVYQSLDSPSLEDEKEISRDYDLLLKNTAVAKIFCSETRLAILTVPLFREEKDFGEVIISIELPAVTSLYTSNPITHLVLNSGQYPGHYTHCQVQRRHPCLGSDGVLVGKLVSEGKIPLLVDFLIHFLEHGTGQINLAPRDRLPPPYHRPEFTPEEKEKTRKAYIRFIKNLRKKFLIDGAQAEFQAAAQKERNLLTDFAAQHLVYNKITQLIQDLLQRFDREDWILEEFREIYFDSRVVTVEPWRKGMKIITIPLEIAQEDPLHIFLFSSGKIWIQSAIGSQFKIDRFGSLNSTLDFKSLLSRLISAGLFGKALKALLDFLSGEREEDIIKRFERYWIFGGKNEI